jgi:hypothetical protein
VFKTAIIYSERLCLKCAAILAQKLFKSRESLQKRGVGSEAHRGHLGRQALGQHFYRGHYLRQDAIARNVLFFNCGTSSYIFMF